MILKRLISILVIVVCLLNNSFAKTNVDQTLEHIKQLTNSNIERAFELINNIKTNDLTKDQQARLENLLSYINLLMNRHETAYEHIIKARDLALEANNLYELAESKRFEASLYTMTNLQTESLPLFLEALKIHKSLKSDKVFYTLQGISLYYRSIENYDKYLEYGQLLLNDPKVKSEKKALAIAHYMIGEGYLKKGQLQLAKLHLDSSIEVFKEISSILISEVYFTKAELFLKE